MGVVIVTRYTKKGKPRYHVRFNNGRDVPVVHLGVYKVWGDADDRRKRAAAMVALDQVPTRELLDQKKKGDHGTFATIAEQWLDSYHASASAMRTKRSHVKRLSAELGDVQPRHVTRATVQEWIDSVLAGPRPLMGSTLTAYLSTLNQILRVGGGVDTRAWWRDLRVPADDYVALDLPNAKRRAARELLSRKIDGKYQVCPDRQRLFDVLEHGGLRISEACSLVWRQVDNENDRLLQIGTKGIKKGGKKKPRTVARLPFQPDWIPKRPADAQDGDRVFPHEMVDGDGFRDALTRACEAAGVEPYRPHDLRHLHATRLNRWGSGSAAKHDLSIRLMADRMGHNQEEFLGLYSDHDMPID